ncbi:hypothetical protein BHM03_00040143 [Ensete ventricosum]|nr:hypothetical protein BHM03_00040143 [Ensete ventricosum]
MDLVSPMEHLCYVRCTYCNTVLAVIPSINLFSWLQVGVPKKPMMDTVTVRCGHCNHVSFLSHRPMEQSHSPTNHQLGLQVSSPCLFRFVMLTPEKKHRMPSAYNRFMR